MKLEMSERDWRFLEGPWTQDADGDICAPGNNGERNVAVYAARAWRDFEAEFEFRWDIVWTDAAFVFRAADATQHYMLHFPVVGQHYRAEHFWAMISKVDDRGWAQGLRMEMVHGVSSMPGRWHRAKLTVRGNEIRAWVDGRPVTAVVDDTYTKPGYIGLMTYSGLGAGQKSRFRNLRIEGEPVRAAAYDEKPLPPRNWFLVTDQGGHGTGNIVRAANGDLVSSVAVNMIEGAPMRQLRSRDNGRTWAVEECHCLPKGPSGLLHTAADGTLEMIDVAYDPPFRMSRRRSADHGRTWSEPQDLGEVTFPPELPWANLYPTRLLETRAGTLCLFFYTTAKADAAKIIRGRYYHNLAIPQTAGYCMRSTDGGDTWLPPIDIDGEPRIETPWMVAKEGSETSVAQTRDGKIIALVRPSRSPLMWETWSEDDGASWAPLARGPFPMYACNNSMLPTASGALVIGGRFPSMGLQVSFDDGMTWTPYWIDTAIWANGSMFEVEPNVVLFLYGGKDGPCQLRAQLIRVTDRDVEPVHP